MAVDKERRLMKIRPSQGLRPFVFHHLIMLLWGTVYALGSLACFLAAVLSFLKHNAVLTTFFLFSAWWLIEFSFRPIFNAILGLKILSLPRDDFLRFESLILRALPMVNNRHMDIVDVSYLEMELSSIRAQLGFTENAEQYARSAKDRILARLPHLTEKQVASLNGFMGMLHCNHAYTLCELNKCVEAEQAALDAQSCLRNFRGNNRAHSGMWRTAPSITLGWLQLYWNELEQARKTFENAAVQWEESMSDTTHGDLLTDHRQAHILLALAAVNAKEDKFDDSLDYFEAFKQLLKVASIDTRTSSIGELNLLCEEYARGGRLDEAESAIGIAYRAGERIPFNVYATRTLDVYEKFLKDTDRESEIEDMRLRVKPIALVE